MWRRNISIVLLASFITVAVFGFVAMAGGSGHAHSGCIAAAAKGTGRCPSSAENAESSLFHWQTFKSFSQALIVGVLILAGFLSAVWFSGVSLGSGEKARGVSRTYTVILRLTQLLQKTRQRIMYWLALHESRPDQIRMGA